LPRPRRRSPRLEAYDYATEGAYFVTVCSAGRQCSFGDVVDNGVRLTPAGEVVAAEWREIGTRWGSVTLDVFAVMPNHLHGILWLHRAGQDPPLPTVVGLFKSGASRKIGRSIWQRSFHDRVIRDEVELAAIRQYITENPLRWAVDRENPNRV
jgi:putative transposase